MLLLATMITIQEIQAHIKAYEAKFSHWRKIWGEPVIVSSLREFCDLRKGQKVPLNEVDLFEFSKILLTYPAGRYDIYKNLVEKLKEEIGADQFLCLQAFYQQGIFNWNFFQMVRTWKLDFKKLVTCLNQYVFSQTFLLMSRCTDMTNPLLSWLIALPKEKLWHIYRILFIFDHYKILNEVFFPLFIYYGKRNSPVKFVNQRDEYCFDGRGWLHLFTELRGAPEVLKEKQVVFAEFVQKIDSKQLKDKFTQLKYVMDNCFRACPHHLSFSEMDKQEVQAFFIGLIKKGILTVERFGAVLSKPVFVSYIKDYLLAVGKPFNNAADAFVIEHFDVLWVISVFFHDEPKERVKNINLIYAHQESFKKVYTPFLIKMSDPKWLIDCMQQLHMDNLLSENIFHAICDDPTRGQKTEIILRFKSMSMPLDEATLTLIRRLKSSHVEKLSLGKMRRLVKSDYEVYLDLMSREIKDRDAKQKIIEQSQKLKEVHEVRTTYFSIVPIEVLQIVSLCDENKHWTYTASQALSIAQMGMNIFPRPPSDYDFLTLHRDMPDKEKTALAAIQKEELALLQMCLTRRN